MFRLYFLGLGRQHFILIACVISGFISLLVCPSDYLHCFHLCLISLFYGPVFNSSFICTPCLLSCCSAYIHPVLLLGYFVAVDICLHYITLFVIAACSVRCQFLLMFVSSPLSFHVLSSFFCNSPADIKFVKRRFWKLPQLWFLIE